MARKRSSPFGLALRGPGPSDLGKASLSPFGENAPKSFSSSNHPHMTGERLRAQKLRMEIIVKGERMVGLECQK